MPFTVDDTGILRGKEPEETTGKVETAVRASRTLVHDGGNSGLSAVRDADLLKAVRTGISTTILLNGQGQATALALEMEARTGVFKATMKSLSTLY